MSEGTFEVALIGKIKHSKLYKLLREKGWSQAELARQLGVSQMTVSKWMLLKGYPRNENVLRKLMDLTGESPFDLFPQFMREDEWRERLAELPREWAVIREIQIKQLMGGKILALPSAEDEYAELEFEERLRETLNLQISQSLTPREGQILNMRFGLSGEREHTLREVGDAIGITRKRVHQIEIRALRKLRGFRHDGEKVSSPIAKLLDR
ncbi:MAG: sigma factor-like helix-turn-helix DNA-binding protein [bacterium]|nr:sigma factor-like helix-turn-helix DNA-binding protein [bacterium]MDZ4284854.1 sigma factor-like helix-turn-helix DNA-binding protein [Patescibacteria group bacterium]